MRFVKRRPISKAVLLIVMACLGCFTSTRLDAQVIYFTDRGVQGVQRANFNCSLVTEPLIENAAILPQALAIDAASETVFWTDFNSGLVRRANLDGTGVNVIVTGLNQPTALAVDPEQGCLYISELGAARIVRVRLDGTDQQTVHSGITTFGIAFDPHERQLYWTDTTLGRIQRSDDLGTNIETAITSAGIFPIGIAIDAVNRRVVWTDFLANQIRGLDLLDGTTTIIAGAPAAISPTTLAINPTHQEVFWVNNTDGSIWSGNYDGTSINEVMISETFDPYGIGVLASPPPPLAGDMNNDGAVDGEDIAGFVEKLLEG